MSPLITVAELYERRNDPLLAIADGSWQPAGGEMRADYARGHIERAVFLDLEAASDHRSALPHMLPTPDAFRRSCRRARHRQRARGRRLRPCGLLLQRPLVVDVPSPSATKRPACSTVACPHGSPPATKSPRGRPSRHRSGFRPCCSQSASPRATMSRTSSPRAARCSMHARRAGSAAREKETRAGLRSGHMPGTINLHYASVLNPDGTFRTPVEIRAMGAGPEAGLAYHHHLRLRRHRLHHRPGAGDRRLPRHRRL
ncbi:MAG: hypothetical protein WDN72_06410 [Alphaproteobacteria bacterium]